MALSHGTRGSARHEAIRLGTGEAEADIPVHRPCTQDYRYACQVRGERKLWCRRLSVGTRASLAWRWPPWTGPALAHRGPAATGWLRGEAWGPRQTVDPPLLSGLGIRRGPRGSGVRGCANPQTMHTGNAVCKAGAVNVVVCIHPLGRWSTKS